ncbi:hypothetical protein [Kitasatospora sp. NPDC056800]|uniref:hypothetical protein n=1 Tax=Kitasatospora sp. NPDC056800 TaxID=3345948 RepID=UPI0036AA5CBC
MADMTVHALAVKRGLIDHLMVAPGLSAFQVSWSFPRNPGRYWVMVGKIDWQDSHWVTNRQTETVYDIHTVVSVAVPGADAEKVESSALQAAEAIRLSLVSDPSVGGIAISSVFVPDRLISWPTPDGHEAQWEGTVRITARDSR